MNSDERIFKQKLTLTDRRDLDIDSVEGISAFDESYIYVLTKAGKLTIEGRDLKIDDLNKDSGKMHVTGEISGIYYSEESKRGGISRFFK